MALERDKGDGTRDNGDGTNRPIFHTKRDNGDGTNRPIFHTRPDGECDTQKWDDSYRPHCPAYRPPCPARPTLTVLGTSALGVPSFFCDCPACVEARRDPRAQRGCCGLAVRAAAAAGTATEAAALTPQPQPQAVTLIDSSPDLRIQLVREQIADVARVIYTHEHYDHIGGLAQLEYYSRLKTKRPLPIYAGEETLAIIEQQFGFMADVLKPHRIVAEEQLLFDDVCYTPLPATHSKGAFGFAIAASDGQGPRVAYFPDTATLPPATAERLMGIDILLIDASFNGENWMPTTHHSIDEAIVTAQALRAGRTYLTHLSMHYSTPISSAELAERLAPFGERIQAAFDGLTLTL